MIVISHATAAPIFKNSRKFIKFEWIQIDICSKKFDFWEFVEYPSKDTRKFW